MWKLWKRTAVSHHDDSLEWRAASLGLFSIEWLLQKLSVNPGSSEETRAKRTRSCCPASLGLSFSLSHCDRIDPVHGWWKKPTIFVAFNSMLCKSVTACVAPIPTLFPKARIEAAEAAAEDGRRGREAEASGVWDAAMVLPKLNPLHDKLDKFDAIYAESVGPWTSTFCNYTNLLFVWAVFGGIRLVDQPRALAAKMIHVWVSIQLSPKCQQAPFWRPEKAAKPEKAEKTGKSSQDAKPKDCHFVPATWWERQIASVLWLWSALVPLLLMRPLHQRRRQHPRMELLSSPQQWRWQRGRTGLQKRSEKVWTSLSFRSMTKKHMETLKNIQDQWSLEEEF